VALQDKTAYYSKAKIIDDPIIATISTLITVLMRENEVKFFTITGSRVLCFPRIIKNDLGDSWEIDIAFHEVMYKDFKELARKLASELMKLGKSVNMNQEEKIAKIRHVTFTISKKELETIRALIG